VLEVVFVIVVGDVVGGVLGGVTEGGGGACRSLTSSLFLNRLFAERDPVFLPEDDCPPAAAIGWVVAALARGSTEVGAVAVTVMLLELALAA